MASSLNQSNKMRRSQRANQSSLSEINVTPFVDVMLVLLVIFMVTAPLTQQGIDVNLPQTAPSGVDFKEDPFVLIIEKNRTIRIGKAQVPLLKLKEKIQAIFKSRKNKQIYIKADKKVDYGIVAEVMAEVKAAGIHQIGMLTLPRTE